MWSNVLRQELLDAKHYHFLIIPKLRSLQTLDMFQQRKQSCTKVGAKTYWNQKVVTTSIVPPEPLCGIGMCTHKKKLEDKKGQLRASLWENLPGLRDSMVFL